MVQFLNCFEVPTGREEEFFDLWREVNAYMMAKPGFVGHRLHRSLADNARFRYVNYATWESVEQWRDAHDAGFRAIANRPEFAPFPSVPALYEVVHQSGTIPAGVVTPAS